MSGLRTTRASVTFKSPFRLSVFDEPLPAGQYDIDTEEEAVEGNERTVYVRVATLLQLRTSGKVQTVTIDPQELATALAADRDPRLMNPPHSDPLPASASGS